MHCVEDELFRVYLEVRGSAASGVLLKLQARGKITSQARWLRIKRGKAPASTPRAAGAQICYWERGTGARKCHSSVWRCHTHTVQPHCGVGHASRASSCPKRPAVTALCLPDARYPSFPSSASRAACTGTSKGEWLQQATGPFCTRRTGDYLK